MTALVTLDEGPSVADLRRDQGGALTRPQLLALGVTDEQIEHRLRSGQWQRLHRGVYATFSGPLPFLTSLWGALLRAGPSATASHHTAAYLDGLADRPGDIVHLTLGVEHRLKHPLPGVRVHYAHRLDQARHPAKSPPRTRLPETVLDLVDIADSVDEVATWVTRACQRRLSTPERIADALDGRKKIRWRPEVEAMVAMLTRAPSRP